MSKYRTMYRVDWRELSGSLEPVPIQARPYKLYRGSYTVFLKDADDWDLKYGEVFSYYNSLKGAYREIFEVLEKRLNDCREKITECHTKIAKCTAELPKLEQDVELARSRCAAKSKKSC